jgi:diguanylate cyclase (GGDEF)-like protein
MTDDSPENINQLSPGSNFMRLVLETCPTARCILTQDEIKKDIISKASLLITNDDPEVLTKILEPGTIPDQVPILILGTAQDPPDSLVKLGKSRLVDYLPLPISRKLLQYKISFLTHTQRISAEYFENLQTHQKVLDTLSKRDGLTGLFNRRYLTEILKNEFQQARINEEDLSLLILNIDYFNEINKSSGLEFGDAVLNEMSARLTLNTRPIDSCYRFSGEDFVILMPKANLELAKETAEKIRVACSEKPFIHYDIHKSITVSIGIASLKTHALENHDELISMAETALYMAKAGGRNRIHIFAPLGVNEEYNSQQSLATLKETINRILEKTRHSTISSLQLLAREIAGLEYKDHIDQVSHYTALLGRQLGLPPHLVATFQNAITLHNSIRFFLHNDLFAKQSKLSGTEREIMDDLPFKLAEITDIFDFFANERTILLSHGERYDGNGAPHGLRGSEIPLGARLFNIVDALAAMNSERPFRSRLKAENIVDELISQAGKQFDPHLVLHTLEMIKNNNLLELSAEYLEEKRRYMLTHFPEIT